MLLLSACAGSDPPASYDVTAAVSERVPTVVNVTWEPADRGCVTFGEHEACGDGRATLFGLDPDADVSYRVTVGDWAGDGEIRTGSFPAGLPGVEVTTPGDLGAPYVLAAWQEFPAESTGFYVIRASDGVPVWSWGPDPGIVQVARPTSDGAHLMYMHTRWDAIEDAGIGFAALDGSSDEEYPLPYAHHDVIEVPGARFAAIVGEVRTVDGEDVVGDRIVEVAEDGTEREVWNAFDHFEVAPNEGWATGTYTAGIDWTHANGLFYDEADDAYYLSLFYLRCVVKVRRSTGEQEWVFGGDSSDFTLTNDDGFGPQHAPELVDGELMFFDNAYGHDTSRLVRYALDTDAWTATRTWEWHHPDALFSPVYGDVDVRAGGGTLSSWGTYGRIVATDATDARIYEAAIETGFLAGQIEAFDFGE